MSEKPTSTATRPAPQRAAAGTAKSEAAQKNKKTGISEELVCDWLSRHPDFLLRHDNLLTRLELPDHSGAAISLHQRQLRVLRDANTELEHKLHQIVGNAKYAQSVSQRLFELAVALLAEREHDALDWLALVREHFELSRATLWLADSRGDSTFALLYGWLDGHGARCDEQPLAEWLREVFGREAGDLGSVAAVAIRRDEQVAGILVLGAADAARFQSSMAVEALEQLGELLSPLLPAA